MRTVKTLIAAPKPVKARQSTLPGCEKCRLLRKCMSPKQRLFGSGGKKIMVVLPYPERIEDKSQGKEKGKLYNLVRETMEKQGIDLLKDCWVTYAVKCYSDSLEDINASLCSPSLYNELAKHRPTLVLLVGKLAIAGYLQHRTSYEASTRLWAFLPFPDLDNKCWVAATEEPATVNSFAENEKRDALLVARLWTRSVRAALACLDKPFPREDYDDYVQLLNDKGAIRYMSELLVSKTPVAFDYETSGIKPENKGHYIQCCSMCTDPERSICFVVNEQTAPYLKQVLKDKDIPKIAHNAKFEHRWSRRILKTTVRGWKWDTMLAAHFLDNRGGNTSLKFQTIVNFGVFGYEEGVGDLWKAKGNNGINRIKHADDAMLRHYCGLDSLFTFRLWQIQALALSEIRGTLEGAIPFEQGLDLLLEGTIALAGMEHNGVLIDTEYLEEKKGTIAGQIATMEEEFKSTELFGKWREKYGMSANIHAPLQLADILYKEMGIEPTKSRDKSEEGSVSKEAILALGNPELAQLIAIKQLVKAKDTFISQILKEVSTTTGRMHPSFTLNVARTFRSSCTNPNMQNMPIRNHVVGKLIRTAFIPEEEGIIVEADLKGAEVCVAQCHNHDPKLREYLLDTSLDMHRDMAMMCYKLDREEVTKEIRYCGKNMWVFPQFYGSYYGDCCDALWPAIKTLGLKTASGEPLYDHLRSKGIRTKDKFNEHLKEVEAFFWNEMFPVYTEWKEIWYKLYLKRGYVDTFTGFRCGGYMRRNAVINYPIQGDAFHCNLWACIQLQKWLKKNKMRTYLFGQIHDSILGVTVAEERDEYIAKVQDILQNQLPKRWPWITVPITVEIEAAPKGKSWYEKKAV